MTEVDMLSGREALTDFEKCADIIVLLYDASNPNDFSYIAGIFKVKIYSWLF